MKEGEETKKEDAAKEEGLTKEKEGMKEEGMKNEEKTKEKEEGKEEERMKEEGEKEETKEEEGRKSEGAVSSDNHHDVTCDTTDRRGSAESPYASSPPQLFRSPVFLMKATSSTVDFKISSHRKVLSPSPSLSLSLSPSPSLPLSLSPSLPHFPTASTPSIRFSSEHKAVTSPPSRSSSLLSQDRSPPTSVTEERSAFMKTKGILRTRRRPLSAKFRTLDGVHLSLSEQREHLFKLTPDSLRKDSISDDVSFADTQSESKNEKGNSPAPKNILFSRRKSFRCDFSKRQSYFLPHGISLKNSSPLKVHETLDSDLVVSKSTILQQFAQSCDASRLLTVRIESKVFSTPSFVDFISYFICRFSFPHVASIRSTFRRLFHYSFLLSVTFAFLFFSFSQEFDGFATFRSPQDVTPKNIGSEWMFVDNSPDPGHFHGTDVFKGVGEFLLTSQVLLLP
jgi:hypothetical protein